DPVVDRSTLDPTCLQRCDIWWIREGGHVMCFGASPQLARRLRKWVEHRPQPA
ncbi:Arsg, partial [Symbiodinium pilosum]